MQSELKPLRVANHINDQSDAAEYLRAAAVDASDEHILSAVRDVVASGVLRSVPLNTSGFLPLDVRVLVKPDAVEEKTAGGIILPEEHRDQQKQAMLKGTLVAVGVNAWEEAASRSAEFVKPMPGARVLIAKYGGIALPGEDGADYRLMNDEDVIGLLEGA